MILIVDSNIILSGLIRDGKTREILINSSFKLCSPETLITEVIKYKDYILKKSRLSNEEFEILFCLLTEKIKIIPKTSYINFISKADEIIGAIDKKDIPFIALALSIPNSKIWTDDNDFQKQNIIEIFTTEQLIKHLEKI